MRVVGISRPPGPDRRRRSRNGLRDLIAGDRVEATVLRRLGARFVLLEIVGRRLVAWMEPRVESGETMYLEVESTGSPPRFRPLTGGKSFWSLPVGRRSRDRLDTTG